MDAKVREAIDFSVEFARKQMMEQGDFMPMFVLSNKDGEKVVIATPWQGEADKVETLKFLRSAMIAMETEAYLFTSEAWALKIDPEKQPGVLEDYNKNWRGTGRSLEEHPNRSEILMVSYCSREAKEFRQFEILRDADGKVSSMEELPVSDGAKISGRMFELLPSEGMTMSKHLIDMAKEIIGRMRIDGGRINV